MRNYQRTLTSIFICHFALTPEPLVRLSRNFVLRILYTKGNFSPIVPKKCSSSGGPSSLQMTNCSGTEEHIPSRWSFATIRAPPSLWFWSFGGQSSLQMTICKGTEEAGSSGWSFATIPAPPSPCFWSSGEPSSLQMTICKGTEEHEGRQIIRMIICKSLKALIYDGTGWYLVVLGQYGAALVGTWWYWVSITWKCLVLSGTGLIKGFYASIYWKKLMVTLTDQPTDRAKIEQSAFLKVWK